MIADDVTSTRACIYSDATFASNARARKPAAGGYFVTRIRPNGELNVSKVAGLFTIAAPGLNGSVSTVVKDTGIFGIAAAMADGNSCPSIGPITGVLPIATIAVAVGSYILGCSSVATYRASGRRYTGAYQESIEGSLSFIVSGRGQVKKK